MRFIKMILFTLTLFVSLSAQIDTNSQHYYMYIYFVQGQNEQALGARLAFSSDAVNWQKYEDEKVIIKPDGRMATGEISLMRDPNTYYDAKTGVFHLVWTTGWLQKTFGYATSKDLTHWSNQVKVPVGERINDAKCTWAPEFLYDQAKDSMMVYWSTDRGKGGKEPFYSMTKDFKHYTEPQVYFAPKTTDGGEGYSVIDETIIKVTDNKYYLFFKDERKSTEADYTQTQNIHYVFGPTPQGPWWKGPLDDVSKFISYPGFEGPTAIIIGDELRVFFDPFNTHANTDRSRTIKLASLQGDSAPPSTAWTTGAIMKTASGTFLPSHGSISEVPRAKVMQILYGIPDKTVYQSWTDISESEVTVGVSSNPTDTVNYPLGKQNMGCGTGFGLAFLPAIFFKGMSFRKRRKPQGKAK